jgi:hypothetical protein
MMILHLLILLILCRSRGYLVERLFQQQRQDLFERLLPIAGQLFPREQLVGKQDKLLKTQWPMHELSP